MRVLLADPPGFTLFYDHELAAGLARAGADVELVSSRFRFGEDWEPDGYRRANLFYPLSAAALPALAAARAGEAPRAPSRHGAHGADGRRTSSTSSGSRSRGSTAGCSASRRRPCSPRTTSCPGGLPTGSTSGASFGAGSNGSSFTARGAQRRWPGTGYRRRSSASSRIPVFPSDPERRDDGRTLLFFGMIRPYRGLGDALAALERVPDARMIVAGDPVEPVDAFRARDGDRVDWRLGFLPAAEVDRAHGDATVAVFPYRPDDAPDQSGSLLRALGAGVPAVVYDVGGLAEPVTRFGAGRVVPAGDVDGLAAAVRELLDDPAALEAAREGARRAREELTWDASARAHLAVYEELVA